MKNKNFQVVFTLLILIVSNSASNAEKLLRPPKSIISLSSDIGTVFTDVGTLDVSILGTYSGNEINMSYLLDLKYFQSYNSHSRSYPSIEELLDGLNKAVQNIQERKEIFVEFILDIEHCDKNKKDGSIKTIISDEWGDEMVEVELYSPFNNIRFSMDINQTIHLTKLLEEANNTIKWISPQLEAFNKTEPKLSE